MTETPRETLHCGQSSCKKIVGYSYEDPKTGKQMADVEQEFRKLSSGSFICRECFDARVESGQIVED